MILSVRMDDHVPTERKPEECIVNSFLKTGSILLQQSVHTPVQLNPHTHTHIQTRKITYLSYREKKLIRYKKIN